MVLTLKDLMEWLGAQDPGEEFQMRDSSRCLLAEYGRSSADGKVNEAEAEDDFTGVSVFDAENVEPIFTADCDDEVVVALNRIFDWAEEEGGNGMITAGDALKIAQGGLRQAFTEEELARIGKDLDIPSLERFWGVEGDYGRFVYYDTGIDLPRYERAPTYAEAVKSLKGGVGSPITIRYNGEDVRVYVQF